MKQMITFLRAKSVVKVKNGGRIPGFLNELGPFFGGLLKKLAFQALKAPGITQAPRSFNSAVSQAPQRVSTKKFLETLHGGQRGGVT